MKSGEIPWNDWLTGQSARLREQLNTTRGPLLGGLWFDAGEGKSGRLLLMIHGLAVDGSSWGILLEDLANAYQQRCKGQVPILPPRGHSYRDYAEALTALAGDDSLVAERDFWENQQVPAPLPRDQQLATDPSIPVHNHYLDLDRETTAALLDQVGPVYNTRPEETILAALLLALCPWAGSTRLHLGLEGSGREEAWLGKLSLERTVGHFACCYPMHLNLPEAEPGAALKAVKEQYRQIPHGGLGYGVLRHLAEPPLATTSAPELSFSYLGILQHQDGDFTLLPDSHTLDRDAPLPPDLLLEIIALIDDGQLRLVWRHRGDNLLVTTVQTLMENYQSALLNLIEHCRHPQAGGFTPSDFPGARVDQGTLDALLSKLK